MGVREESRARTQAAIMLAARAEIAEHGGGGLSMRRVAREVGLVSSAIYRYFASREALLTAMIVESYGSLAAHLPAGGPASRAEQWTAAATAFRRWALTHPHEFQLVYGTPIPGYVAPPETVPAAEAVAAVFLDAGARSDVPGFDSEALFEQMGPLSGVDRVASGAAAVLAELAALVGFVNLELSGHFRGTADPADPLFDALLARQVRTLELDPLAED